MAVNRYSDHVLVVPEDDANRQLANGFITHFSVKPRAIQVLNPEGGWLKVLSKFQNLLIEDLRNYPKMHLVLLVDFDNDYQGRIQQFKQECPQELCDRFYVLGVRSEPESIKRAMAKSYETIGHLLVDDCRGNANTHWSHSELQHNLGEIARLNASVSPFLFK